MKKYSEQLKIVSFIIIMMMIAKQNFAQPECTYSICNTITKEINSAITINSATTWETGTAPNDYTCTIVNAKVTINSSLTINAVDLKMTTNGWFQINNGGTLTITSGTEIYAYSNMWGSTAGGSGPDGGIKVKGGGTLNVDGAIIAEAYLAINDVSNSTDGEANIYLDGTCFFNNQVAIVIGPYTGTMDSHIIGCRFAAPSLISPLSGIGDIGIYLNQVRPTTPFLIGDNLQYQAVSAHNEFEQLDVAIESYRSNTSIVDNLFHEINIGIRATGTPNVNTSLTVGRTIIPPEEDHQLFNRFTNAINAIVVSNNVKTYIYHNWIESDYDEATGEYIMERAIDISNTCPEIIIDINFIHNFNNRGIYIHNNPGATNIYIHFNSLVEYSPLDNIVSTGIAVAETTAGSSINLNIDGNQIVNVLTGIRLINIDDATLYYNIPTYQHLDGGAAAYGIRMSNCDNAIVSSNACTGNYETGLGFEDYVRGIYLEDCKSFELSSNSSNTASEGIYILGTSDDGNIYCNRMTDCDIGILLLDIDGTAISSPLADIITNPYGEDPSGNHWFDEYSANRVTTDGSTDCRATTWYYYDDLPEYDIPVGLVTQIFPSYLPDFTWIEGAQCTAYPEMMEVAEYNYEALIEGIENDFESWASAYNEDEIEDSPLTWFKLYRFWNCIVNNGIAAGDLSSELQNLYGYVGTTNIPLIDALTDSISQNKYAESQEILNNITPNNDIEYYWELTSQIYLNNSENLDSTGVLVLNEDDEITLRNISELSGSLNGPGVYQSWAILDTTIDRYREINEERWSLSSPVVIYIAPNPAQNCITLICSDMNYLNSNIGSVEVFDISGCNVKTFYDVLSTTLFIGDIANGLYLFRINMQDGTYYGNKILIQK